MPFVLFILKTFKIKQKTRSNHFGPILSGFSWITAPNEVHFVQKFYLCCKKQGNASHVLCFLLESEKFEEIKLKNWISGSF